MMGCSAKTVIRRMRGIGGLKLWYYKLGPRYFTTLYHVERFIAAGGDLAQQRRDPGQKRRPRRRRRRG